MNLKCEDENLLSPAKTFLGLINSFISLEIPPESEKYNIVARKISKIFAKLEREKKSNADGCETFLQILKNQAIFIKLKFDFLSF